MQATEVLIVEDDFFLAGDMARSIEGAGYNGVVLAHSVAEGLALAEQLRPQVALLDFHLRKGLVCRLGLDLHSRGVPVIVVSGYPEKVACAQMPFRSAYLSKPFTPEELLRALAEAIGEGAAALPNGTPRARGAV